MDYAIGMLVGFLVGCAVTVVVYDHAFRSTARWQRTGRPNAREGPKTALPGSELHAGVDRAQAIADRGQGASIEGQAAMRARERVLERGTDALMAATPGLTREKARAMALQALEETGAFNMAGGIPSA